MPRPQLLTKARATRILKALKIGATRAGAANVAGVHVRTLQEWIAFGRAGKEPYAAFVATMEAQQEAWEVTALEVVTKAAKKNWTAAAWKLERLKPKRYARRMDEETINRRVEDRLQAVLKHAEEEWRRRLAAGTPQRLIEGKDDGQQSQGSGGTGIERGARAADEQDP